MYSLHGLHQGKDQMEIVIQSSNQWNVLTSELPWKSSWYIRHFNLVTMDVFINIYWATVACWIPLYFSVTDMYILSNHGISKNEPLTVYYMVTMDIYHIYIYYHGNCYYNQYHGHTCIILSNQCDNYTCILQSWQQFIRSLPWGWLLCYINSHSILYYILWYHGNSILVTNGNRDRIG